MRNFSKGILLGVLLLATGYSNRAFSLLGPFATYQIPSLNYESPFTSIALGGDEGGPMNLGEEYRWGSPVVVYGFDSSFVEYFGAEGVAAVEAAIKLLNDLPATASMSSSLNEFPLNTTRFNYTAQQLRLRDLKSTVLSILLQQMGLACPERYTWTIYQQRPIDGTDPQLYVYSIIQRNFDPITFRPSAYVNNTLYTYQILQISANPDTWDCQELAVDVANPNVSVVATAGLQAGAVDPRIFQQVYGALDNVFGGFGLFYSGLTRDDAAGFRYLYRNQNTNWQSAPLGTVGSASYSPWANISFQIVYPNPISPWTVVGGPILGATNGVIGVIGSGFQDTGGRAGPGKLNFVRVDTDPLLGQYLVPVTVSYPETVIDQNGLAIRQVAARTILTPDIVFSATDLGAYPNDPSPYVYGISGTTFLQTPNPGVVTAQDGPGILETGVTVALNKVGPWLFNFLDSDQLSGIRGFTWGSFDGTTNAPIVYPVGASAAELESRLFP